MYQDKRIAVIIAAAGSGKRMGSGISKQFRLLGNEMVLEKTLKTFCNHPLVDDLYLVVKKEDVLYCQKVFLKEKNLFKIRAIVAGGNERQDSVLNALDLISRQCKPDYVLVHDGARPFISAQGITRLIEKTVEYNAAVLGVPVKDTIKRGNGLYLEETLKRETLFSVQTPQGFDFKLLYDSYKKAKEDCFYGTDDSSLVERTGKKVYLVMGEYDNIKITTKEDLAMLKEWRCGTGYDVHAFVKGRKLILGGVLIPYNMGLLGHSDGDVLTHAVMDALLGAGGLGDIGMHFPDSEVCYKDISSLNLLINVKEIIKKAGWSVGNIDITVIAEKPKIAPYRDDMKVNLAKILEVNETQINIKGTTTEKLGFCGREEGMAANAIAMIYRE
ncbi:MAG: 2-C-methyl-D-erythritol 4-phosphate cytidylyltransferase [Eubacteriales bacterium]|nr:2-C-methyl-D-erythritol 4-phosphate cytidylyltransferase [Eubacteriales bacterium]MDD4582754.1 2-C-methyl-D-erythritol 4-phosphate cytidylyltransferase [Eubacteriales bacterium]